MSYKDLFVSTAKTTGNPSDVLRTPQAYGSSVASQTTKKLVAPGVIIDVPNPKSGMEFKVGQGLNPEQTQVAMQTVNKPAPVAPQTSYNMNFKKLFVDTLRAPARAITAVGASMAKRDEPIESMNPIARTLLGDEPVTPIARQAADIELALKDYGFNKGALPLSVGATVISGLLDLYPPTAGKTQAVKQGVKQATKEVVKKEAKLTSKEIIQNATDNAYKKLKELLPNLQEGVLSKRATMDEWADASKIVSKIGKTGKAEADDLLTAHEIIKRQSTMNQVKPKVNVYNQSGSLNVGAIAEDTKTAALKGKTEFFDRYAPIENLVQKKNIPIEKNPYIAARNYAGHIGKVENRLDELSNVLRPHRDIMPQIKQYALLDRYDELAGRGITKFPDKLTPESIRNQKQALEATLGQQGMAKVQEALTGIRAFNDKLLTEAKDAGIISEASYSAIKTNNEKYIPLQRLEYLGEHADDIERGSNSFSVSTQNLIKPIKGSEKEVADPLESMVRNIYSSVALIERNKVAQKVADLAKLPEFKETVIPVKGEVPRGMKKISVFRDGVKEEFAVPQEVAAALKNLNEKEADLITKWIGQPSSKVLRAGATTYNPLFIPSNIIRDYQTARLASRVGFNLLDWMKGFSEAIGKGKDYKAFLEGGGASGFFQLNKSVAQTTKELTQTTGEKVIKTITNPIELLKIPGKLIRGAGEITELAPRLGVFKRSLKQGLSPTEAVFNARNATVDFSRYGNSMKVINYWVPFVNARLQGTANAAVGLGKGIKEKPIQTLWKVTTLIGLPVVATYLNNTQRYPEVWDDISETDKRNNFVLIFGNGVDEKGNPTQVVKIPKGEVKIISNPLETLLDYLNGKDPKNLNQLATEILGDISPVGFEKQGKLSGGQVASSILPPIVKGGVESLTNKNLYSGYDIVPESMKNTSPREQYDDKTSTLAKELGQALNWSPKKIDNFIGTQFGGVGRQITSPESFWKQFKNKFLGARGGQQEQDLTNEARKAVQEQADTKVQLRRQAESTLKSIEESNTPEQRFNELAKDNPDLAEMVADLKEKKDLGFTDKDYVIQQLGVENGERAKFLKYQFEKLKTDEEKAALWDDLVTKKLISKKIAEQLTELLKQ